MADQKISALTSSTTPLAGTEVLPIVQSSTTKKVSVANLTAGRAISASEVTASTGNFIMGAANKGIDFSVNSHAAGMTSKTLIDYEEGTWTPSVDGTTSGTAAAYFFRPARYIKVGRNVTAWCTLAMNGIGTLVGNFKITGLPFTAYGNYPEAYSAAIGLAQMSVTAGATVIAFVNYGTSEVLIYQELNGAVSPVPVGAQFDIYFTLSYMT